MATTTTLVSVDVPTLRSFRDLDLNFTNHPIRKDVTTFSNEYAIINSVKNLIFTQHFERPFQPELGSNLRRMLFEPVDSITAAQIEREITEVVSNFEPRANISKVIAKPNPDQNGYGIEVEFFLVNNPNPVSINFFLERIR
jgi:phage baseplate assembly protein W